MTRLLSRTLALLVALTFVLGACSSDGEAVTAEDTETTTTAATATTAAPVAEDTDSDDVDSTESEAMSNEDAADEDVVDADDAMSDDGTTPDEPIAVDGGDGIGSTDLEQMLPFFGITDPVEAAECVTDEANDAGLTVDELLAAGDAITVAIIRCRPDQVRDAFATDFGEVESSSMAATPEQISCGLDSLMDYIGGIDLLEAEGVLQGDAPDDLVNKLADDCGMSTDDADFLLNDA